MLVLALMVACTTQQSNEQLSLPRADAASLNVDTSCFANIFRDLQYSSTSELHSLMVVKDGKVIYERYDIGHTPDELHIQWSATKTYTALGIGFARQDGLLDVDDKLVEFLSEDEIPSECHHWLEKVTIKHLLTMSSGLNPNEGSYVLRRSDSSYDPLRATLSRDFDFEPGGRYRYNSMDSYLLSVIVTKVTGKTLSDYLDEKLFTPLGITDYVYDRCQLGYSCGGWGLFLSTESMAKAGLFMLQKGKWKGEQLLEESWFDEAMTTQIMQSKGLGYSEEKVAELAATNDWEAGYCYQMWKCKYDSVVRMDGAFGQLVFIMPEKNAVAVLTSHSTNTREEFESFWNNVYCKL